MADLEEASKALADAPAEETPAPAPEPEPEQAAPAGEPAEETEQEAPALEPERSDPEEKPASGLEAALEKLQQETKDAETVERLAPDKDTVSGLKEETPKETKQETTAEPEKPAKPAPDASKEPADEDDLSDIKSEKTRARFQRLAQERTQAQQQLQTIYTEVTAAGFDNESFATVLDIGRRASSSDPEQKRIALKMIDKIRENIAADLGEEGPGIDLLKDYPDLAQKVEDLEMDRDSALEVAKARRIEAAQQAEIQAAQQAAQQQQAQQQAVAAAQAAVQNTLNAHRTDIDFRPRIAALQSFLKSGNNLQQITSQPPQMWASTLELLYQNMGSVTAARAPQPISARAMRRGTLQADPNSSPEERLMAKIKAMGI